MLDLIRKGENNQAPTEVILQDLATMVGGPREDYTKVISGVLGSNGHKLSKTKIILRMRFDFCMKNMFAVS